MRTYGIIVLAFLLVGCGDKAVDPRSVVEATAAAEVFKRAFWKRPTSKDRILHAERQEWNDANGLKKWCWFLIVEPSPTLLKHLREDNAFGMITAMSVASVGEAPAWFVIPNKDVDILRSPQSNTTFVFNRTTKLLYASDSGSGFSPSVTVINR